MKVLLILLCSCTLFGKEIHPVTKVNRWFKDEKGRTEGRFSKIATLATISPSGIPHTRIVEITHLHPQKGATFFTRQKSETETDLSFNPQAALNIYLPRTHRQVSITGNVALVDRQDVEKAWNRMPLFMKRIFLSSTEEEFDQHKKLAPKIPCPETFIGYHLKPERIVFYETPYRFFPKKEITYFEKGLWNFCKELP